MERIEGFFEKSSGKLLWAFISLYVSIFSYLCILKYNSFNYIDWDFASDIIVLWNSIHGKLFYYPFLEQVIFGAHLYLIIVLLIPIYAVFQHPAALLILQSLFLGLAAYPLYKLANLKLNKKFALLIALVYLLYPSTGYINLFETHFEIYEIFFLFFALYYFEKENFKRFLAFIVLAMACKENVSLAVFMMGIYAFIRKRPKKWILLPSLLGIIWFFLSIKIIIPHFAKDAKLYQGGFIFSVYYTYLGKTFFEMAGTVVTHPIMVIKYALSSKKVLYILHLFAPTAFLGLMSPAILLITAPIFAQNLLSTGIVHANIAFQYAALLIPFIFYSTIYAFSKLLNLAKLPSDRIILAGVFLLSAVLSGVYLQAPQLHLVKYMEDFRVDDFVKEKEKLVKMVPKDASVIATFRFLPKLAQRHNLYSMHFVSTGVKMYTDIKYEPPQNLEYALIDFDDPLFIISFFPPDIAPDNIRSFLENGNWKVLKGVDDLVLFKKGMPNGHNLFEAAEGRKIQNIFDANIDNQIIFAGYDIDKENLDKDNILHLTYYWKRIGNKPDRQLGFFLQFLNSNNEVVLQKLRPLGYRVWIPKNWPSGKIIKEHNYIFIPEDIKRNSFYNIKLGLFSLGDGAILPVISDSKVDRTGLIDLGDVSL